MRRSPSTFVLALALLATAPAKADEEFHYHWRLTGFIGRIASLFVPSEGDGRLTIVVQPEGAERCELLVTSGESAEGEYFRYGAEWRPAEQRTVRAWSDLVWRGETKSKRADLDEGRVVDVVSAIQLLRRDPPSSPKRLEIWSDGKLYPVLAVPRETESRELNGETIEARRFSFLAIPMRGRKPWKGEYELWIGSDAAATPLEIVLQRTGARLRLELVAARRTPPEAGAASAPGGS